MKGKEEQMNVAIVPVNHSCWSENVLPFSKLETFLCNRQSLTFRVDVSKNSKVQQLHIRERETFLSLTNSSRAS